MYIPTPARRAGRCIRHFARAATAPLRMLPSVIVIGGQKCGTTSLFRYLSQHPNIVPPRKKEPGFFDRRWDRGLDWYRRTFPLEIAHPNDITLEASTGYINYPHAPPRIAATLPEVKLIALVRNPIDRAWSHYHHTVRLGHEPLSFEDALEVEEARLGLYYERVAEDPIYDDTRNLYAYLARGRYAEQLEMWLEHVRPDQLLVLPTEDLAEQPEDVMSRTFDFIGQPAVDGLAFERHNEGTNNDRGVPPRLRERLREYFTPHNERLYALLGRDLGWR